MEPRSSVVFALNGQRVELKDVDPRMSLLSYIRNETHYKGTKYGCGEGGCGACVVLQSKYDPESKKVEEYTINSCLALICSIDGSAITTTEGLKYGKEPHAVHTRLAGFHASQCGYCTPGMAVSIYSSLRNGSTKSHVVDLEKAIAGNICRCTGYRPILDACKSFASDVDIEDLGINTFWDSNQDEKPSISQLNVYAPEQDPKFPSFLQEDIGGSVDMQVLEQGVVKAWKSPKSLTELFDIYKAEQEKNRDVQLVVGNTGSGVYKEKKSSVYIDMRKIPELQGIKRTESAVEIGAAVSLSKLVRSLEDIGGPVLSGIAKHIRQVASEHIRNRASLGGNLILAQKRGFASDVATILLGARSEVFVVSPTSSRTLDLEQFLASESDETTILQSVRIPSWDQFAQDESQRLFFQTYRSSPRPNGNAVSSINAAFLAVVQSSPEENTGGIKIEQLRLAFGALGGPHATRAEKTEQFLKNKVLRVDILKDSVGILREEIRNAAKDDSLHTADYRTSVAVGFLFRFLETLLSLSDGPDCGMNGLNKVHAVITHSLANGSDHGTNGSIDKTESSNGCIRAANGTDFGHDCTSADENANGRDKRLETENGANPLTRYAGGKFGLRTYGRKTHNHERSKGCFGNQSFAVSKEFYPVAQPTGKFGVILQATGEAVYVDDIPSPPGTLHGAFVLSSKALAKINSVDTSDAMTAPGALSFITVKDIPPNGENIGSRFEMTNVQDKALAEEIVGFVGHPIGVMVADTHEHAVEAAARVNVDYDASSLGRPILTVEDAVAKNSLKKSIASVFSRVSVGEALVKGDHRIDNAEIYAGGQYYFYMETQTTLAVPDEDECITVYSSNQSPEPLQRVLARALGIPIHNVRVITRRLGGAFGGKNSPSQRIAVACAIAAFKLKKPVRIVLNRDADMIYCGGRHESKATYSVEFNNDGKITALETHVLMNGGFQDDYSDIMSLLMSFGLKGYNWTSWRHESQVCRTNLPTRSMMRAPAVLQGNFFAESVIEHVAAFLGLDPIQVRETNLHTYKSAVNFYGPEGAGTEEHFTLQQTWKRLKKSSNYEARSTQVKNYNNKQLWTKRGLSMTPVLYLTAQTPRLARVTIFTDGSVAVESGGTEMGQGLFTKVQQAASYGLSKVWGEDGAGKVPLSLVRIVQNDSISLGNAGETNAGTTSEGTCDAVLNACKVLVENLQPLVVELEKKTGKSPSWEAVINLAKQRVIPLSAQAQHSPDTLNARYIVYGACATEVEVDVITGAASLLRADMLYDTGKSLNPAVDIGQIEGAFVQGLGYYVTEEVKWDADGVLITNGTWTYKPPTIDNIPRQFNVELLNSAPDTARVLSSKSAGEPPVLLATSVHNAIRDAIKAARADLARFKENLHHVKEKKEHFLMNSSANMEVVKRLCGYDNVDVYLEWLSSHGRGKTASM